MIGFMALSGLAIYLAEMRRNHPRDVTDVTFTLGMLALGVIGLVLITRRSRAVGVPPWVTLFGIVLAAYLAPVLAAIIMAGLLIAPGKARPAS